MELSDSIAILAFICLTKIPSRAILVICALPSGRELWRSRVTVCLCVCVCLGIFTHRSFCKPGTSFQDSASTPTRNPQMGQKCILVLAKYRLHGIGKGLFSVLREFKLRWLLNIKEEGLTTTVKKIPLGHGDNPSLSIA